MKQQIINAVEIYLTYPDQFQEQAIKTFMGISDFKNEETLPEHVIQGIKKGQKDIESGRSISLEAFKRKLSINNI